MAPAAFAPSPSYHLAEAASFRSFGDYEERSLGSHHHGRGSTGAYRGAARHRDVEEAMKKSVKKMMVPEPMYERTSMSFAP